MSNTVDLATIADDHIRAVMAYFQRNRRPGDAIRADDARRALRDGERNSDVQWVVYAYNRGCR